ncbi:T-cell ecto-ADP-ribosyltransferase 1-like [Pygocentrus nattereri]|uniref:T-cell ecto-ADP-ribosyltransferase 1-like n=1 Tax=Pygocentrus nattereri TaxID=42514 RepID=UPI001891CF8F|nr:T-cell ecto-ADP-ribosyltransferase 1-like [Pygocentrus nattereri]
MTDYPNSIDDEFEGCKEDMYKQVQTLLDEELNSNGNFMAAWNKAKSHRSVKSSKSASKLTEKKLRDKLKRLAILAYTGSPIHRELNDKMREGRGTYMTGFGLISLHFLLTDVIQTRNAEQYLQHECRNTYRRNNITTEITGPSVRFGSFASSSLFPDKTHFGSETCFIITTCYGADISMISWFGDGEAEVLIPPYEVFESKPVTNIPPELSDCKRVYKLHSERDDSKHKKSNMKCEFFRGMAAAGPSHPG